MTHDLVIRNGTVVDGTGASRFVADVAIDGEVITQVGSVEGTGRREIDADGHIVSPGFIDVHTHMELPTSGTVSSDTFESGTIAAAWGGTTTIVDFPTQTFGRQVRECLDEWHAKAEADW